MSRWGRDDQRGAANLLGPETVWRGLASVRSGRVFSLASTLRPEAGPLAVRRAPLRHDMVRDGTHGAERGGFGFADDVVEFSTHGTTHVDALAHVWRDGLMYNDFPSSEVTGTGAQRCGIEQVGAIVTRVLVVDAVPPGRPWLEPGEAVGPERVQERLDRAGLVPEPGDALLVRTGWLEWWRAHGALAGPHVRSWTGLRPDCADWVVEADLVLVGCDNPGVEVLQSPPPDDAAPLHMRLLRDHGIYLMELVELAELARAHEGAALLIANPLPIEGATGGPVAPVVVI